MRHAVADAIDPSIDVEQRSHGVCWEPRGGLAKFDMVTKAGAQAPGAPASKFGSLPFKSAAGGYQPSTTLKSTTSLLRVVPEQDPTL